MTIYIDSDYKCYVSNADGRRAVETDWVNPNGEMFRGEMVSPWKDLGEAYAAQAAYVTAQNAQYEAALTEIEAALEVQT